MRYLLAFFALSIATLLLGYFTFCVVQFAIDGHEYGYLNVVQTIFSDYQAIAVLGGSFAIGSGFAVAGLAVLSNKSRRKQ